MSREEGSGRLDRIQELRAQLQATPDDRKCQQELLAESTAPLVDRLQQIETLRNAGRITQDQYEYEWLAIGVDYVGIEVDEFDQADRVPPPYRLKKLVDEYREVRKEVSKLLEREDKGHGRTP